MQAQNVGIHPRLGDRQQTTRWIKIISHHKTWEILFITYLPPNYLSFELSGVGIHSVNVILKNHQKLYQINSKEDM